MDAPLTENKSTWSARSPPLLAAQDPKTTYALGNAGPRPCQPGCPLVVRGIAAGQLGLGLEWTPVGNLNMDLEGHQVPPMPSPLESLPQLPVSGFCRDLFARHPSTCPNCRQLLEARLEELRGCIAPLVS